MTELKKAKNLIDLLDTCPVNQIIADNLTIAWSKINSPMYQNICCFISGGADSDIMLDIIWRCDKDNKVKYFWHDTGLEYQATKDHLNYLEQKYNIEIIKYKAKKPIPLTCKEDGQPFLSKFVSEMLNRAQKHNFTFENKSVEELILLYPKAVGVCKWWCNEYEKKSLTIRQNKWLKEFILQNPPTFKISSKCCDYAKKDVAKTILKETNADLNITGVRKAEGGVRSWSYKNCFSENIGEADDYRPLFWYTNADKKDYEKAYGITHSDCYTKYGFRRTGCVCCPFSAKSLEEELMITKQYEPKLYNAACVIFKDSYEYTKQYYDFYREMNKKQGLLY